jgi:hypothetical protein
VAIEEPPQLPKYHFQLPPAPNLPPLKVSVLLWPRQIVDVPLMLVAGTDVSLMVMVLLTQLVTLQPFKPLIYIVCVPTPKAAVVITKESPDPSPT